MEPALRESEGIKLYRSKELTSAFVGIAQVIFASITIYRARGDQIEKYGYAAYGLSVYPYLLMSLANLIKLLVCGRYPYVYVLRTDTLVEAEGKGGVFSGAVGNFGMNHGEVFSDPPSSVKLLVPIRWLCPLGNYRGYRQIVPIIGNLFFLIGIFSQLVLILLLSGVKARQNSRGLKIWTPKAGQSTRAQRIWMLGWLVANVCSGPRAHFTVSGRGGEGGDELFNGIRWVDRWISYVFVFLAYVFAFGGFATIGGMLHAEGSYQPC